MSTTHRPAARPADRPAAPTPSVSADRPTATFPTGQWLAHLEAHRERLADLWEDVTPTGLLPVVGPAEPAAGPGAASAARTAFPAVDGGAAGAGRGAGRDARAAHRRAGRGADRRRRHLRSALAGLLIAAALLTGMQLYAAAGISSARQAALQSARESAGAHAYSTPSQRDEQAAPPGPSRPPPSTKGGSSPLCQDKRTPRANG